MKKRKVIAMFCLALSACGAAKGEDFHVGPRDHPFTTLDAARDAARKSGTGAPRRILVHGGRYFLTAPFVLDARDSGLRIEAAGDGEPVLFGGRQITGWAKDGDSFWSASVPEAVDRKWDFRVLIVNGRFCKRARYPEEGFLEHETKFDVPWMSTTGGGWKRKPTPEELTTMRYKPGDLGPWLDIRSAELTIYHSWDESVVGLAALDDKKHTLTFSNPSGHPPGAFHIYRYEVWNIREGMTEPGQWYLDRTAGKVVYRPRPGEDMETAEVMAPAIDRLVEIRGSENAPVKDVTLRGLTLSLTNAPLKAGGFGAGHFDGAIHLVGAEACAIQAMKIANVGGQAIKAWKCGKLKIEDCEIHHTGAGGIRLGGDENLVTNNAIHHVGLTYPSAIALSCGGCRNEISHNTIHDTPYSAITCSKDDNRIEHNRIHHCMQQLVDGAAVYITFCKNVTVRGNFASDIVDLGRSGCSAYYIDEQGEGCVVEGNLAIRVPFFSLNHMARKNAFRNNIFIADGDAKVVLSKCEDYCFDKNIFYTTGSLLLSGINAVTSMPDNLIFSGNGQVVGEAREGYKKLGSGPFEPRDGTVIADPLFDSYDEGIVNFKPGSPALKLGIKPLDVSKAGRKAGPQ